MASTGDLTAMFKRKRERETIETVTKYNRLADPSWWD